MSALLLNMKLVQPRFYSTFGLGSVSTKQSQRELRVYFFSDHTEHVTCIHTSAQLCHIGLFIKAQYNKMRPYTSKTPSDSAETKTYLISSKIPLHNY